MPVLISVKTEMPVTVRRILLALDNVNDRAALEAAAALAQQLQASLQGLFVEDSDLLRVAQLPFAQEVAFTSAIARRLELAQLERELKTRAEELRRLLESLARQRRFECSFTVVRGALLSAVLTAAEKVDIYILGRPPALYNHLAEAEKGPVMTVFDGTPSAIRAMEAAAALSQGGPELIVLIPSPATKEGPDHRRQAAKLLTEIDVQAHIIPTEHLTPSALARTARAYKVKLLVLGEDAIKKEPAMLPTLLKETVSPLAIAR